MMLVLGIYWPVVVTGLAIGLLSGMLAFRGWRRRKVK